MIVQISDNQSKLSKWLLSALFVSIFAVVVWPSEEMKNTQSMQKESLKSMQKLMTSLQMALTCKEIEDTAEREKCIEERMLSMRKSFGIEENEMDNLQSMNAEEKRKWIGEKISAKNPSNDH